jgi:hypothetical protein
VKAQLVRAIEEALAGTDYPCLPLQVAVAVRGLSGVTRRKAQAVLAGTAVMGFNLPLTELLHSVPVVAGVELITEGVAAVVAARVGLVAAVEALLGTALGLWPVRQILAVAVAAVKGRKKAVRAALVLQFSVIPSGLH